MLRKLLNNSKCMKIVRVVCLALHIILVLSPTFRVCEICFVNAQGRSVSSGGVFLPLLGRAVEECSCSSPYWQGATTWIISGGSG